MWRRDPDGRVRGPCFGLVQTPGSVEPDGGWVWSSGARVGYLNWGPGQPFNANNEGAFTCYFGREDRPEWQDSRDRNGLLSFWQDAPHLRRAQIIEIE